MVKVVDIPPGAANCHVRIIDSTVRLGGLPTTFFFTPLVEGFDIMPTLPCWIFLIEHSSGKKVLFDLGIRKDWENLAPHIASRIKGYGWDVKIEKNITEILEENGVSLKELDSIIWSHHHWDHVGDPSLFPSTTELVVGPGFENAYLPGWPAGKESPILESDYKGRELREITFTEAGVLQIGQLKAFDFFGDGSFYLLDTPGHTIGHLAGLLRTSVNPETFLFMGGDLCHHGGELRPSPQRPLPAEINPHPLREHRPRPCPGSVFIELQQKRSRTADQPIFDLTMGYDIPEATRTIRKTQAFDADDNLFLISAHDDALDGIIETFPKAYANDWKARGWGDQARWAFLKDLVPGVADRTQL